MNSSTLIMVLFIRKKMHLISLLCLQTLVYSHNYLALIRLLIFIRNFVCLYFLILSCQPSPRNHDNRWLLGSSKRCGALNPCNITGQISTLIQMHLQIMVLSSELHHKTPQLHNSLDNDNTSIALMSWNMHASRAILLDWLRTKQASSLMMYCSHAILELL